MEGLGLTLTILKALWIGFSTSWKVEDSLLRKPYGLVFLLGGGGGGSGMGYSPTPSKPYGWLMTSFSLWFLQVMLAASYWSLLAPAVEMATSSGGFGAFAFFPVAVGFTLGAAFVYLADLLMPHLVSIVVPLREADFSLLALLDPFLPQVVGGV